MTAETDNLSAELHKSRRARLAAEFDVNLVATTMNNLTIGDHSTPTQPENE